MADLVSKLTLDTAQFDRNINTTKRKVSGLDSSFAASAKNIAAAAGGIGVAFLGIQTAGELFNKTINSIQTTGDLFQKRMDQMKGASDLFFSSIAQGNLNLFIDGLRGVIAEAGKLSEMLDNLGTAKLFGGVESARLDLEIERNRRIAKDKTLSDMERTEAVNNVNRLVKEKQALTERLSNMSVDAAEQSFNTGLKKLGFEFKVGSASIPKLMDNIGTGEAAKIGAKVADLIKQSKEKEAITMSGGMQGSTTSYYETEAAKAAKAELEAMKGTARGRWELANYYASIVRDDKESEAAQAVNLYIEAYNSRTAQLKQETKLLSLNDFKEKTPISGAVVDQGKESSDAVARQTAKYGRGFGEDMTNQLKGLDQLGAKLLEVKKQGSGLVTTLEDLGKVETVVYEGVNDLNGAVARFSDTLDELNYTAARAFSGIEGIFGTDFISQGMQMLSVIDSLRSTMALLDKAKEQSALITQQTSQTNKQANEEEAQSAMVAFSAQLLKWYSWAGVFAPALALGTTMAATAVLGAAVSAIPRFETGGIVGGSSFSGDNMLIRANSGEMVLNQNQQANLFKQINSPSNGGGRVTFEISGRTLRGVLDNESSKNRFT